MVLKKKNLIIGAIILVLALALAFFLKSPRLSDTVSAEPKQYNLPVIMYHSVRQDPDYSGKYVVTPELLRSDIEYLLDNGYMPVGVEDLFNFVNGNGQLPPKPVLLTFDDGYYNNYAYVFPILKEYGVKAVFSVVGYYIDNYSLEEQATAYSYLTWDQVSELHNSSLVEIANHSYNMHDSDTRMGICQKDGETTQQYIASISEDVSKMQELLKNNCNIDCKIFTYPFGNYDKAGAKAIEDLGFICSLSCEEGINSIELNSDLHLLKRYNRDSGKSSAEFFNWVLAGL